MKTDWTVEELVQHFTLQADEREFLGLNDPHNQLGKAILLKMFQYEAQFPQDKTDIPTAVIEFLAQQLYIPVDVWSEYQWDGRRMSEHRQQIRDWIGFVGRVCPTKTHYEIGSCRPYCQKNIAYLICVKWHTNGYECNSWNPRVRIR